jgi:hypothetical protein
MPIPSHSPPHVIVIAGPNGAGKSTVAPRILKGTLSVKEFVNADVIARGLSAFEPERAAIAAGKVMLRRLWELAEERANFAFETTLASRSFAPWIASLCKSGYEFHLLYYWVPSYEMSVRLKGPPGASDGWILAGITFPRTSWSADISQASAIFLSFISLWRRHGECIIILNRQARS